MRDTILKLEIFQKSFPWYFFDIDNDFATKYYFNYLFNRSLRAFSKDYNLASHNITVVCVLIFNRDRHNTQFNIAFERLIFKKVFMAILIYLLVKSICQKIAENKLRPEKLVRITS